jgi:hypothetical protein
MRSATAYSNGPRTMRSATATSSGCDRAGSVVRGLAAGLVKPVFEEKKR